jgi:hypothetical protein
MNSSVIETKRRAGLVDGDDRVNGRATACARLSGSRLATEFTGR